MSKSKLSDFIGKLAGGLANSSDPFDENFFDIKEHLRDRDKEEQRIIEEALDKARSKGERLEREKQQSKYREAVMERPRDGY